MTHERPFSAPRVKKPKKAAERQIADASGFLPDDNRRTRQPTTTLAHADAASRMPLSRRALLQGRQVTESTQAPAMAAALESEMKKDENAESKATGKHQ